MTSCHLGTSRSVTGLSVCGIALCVLAATSSTLTSAVLVSDLFLSTAETAVLLESEQRLLGFVHSCLTKTAVRTGDSEYSRLAEELHRELGSLPSGQDAGHPVDAYVGLRRFTQYWTKYITKLPPVVGSSVERSLAQNRLVYPDDEVLHQARLAIVRLQAAYNLTALTLTASAHANLTAGDAACLADEARLTGFPAVAEGWRLLPLGGASSTLTSSSPSSGFVGQACPDVDRTDADSLLPQDHVVRETLTIQKRHSKFHSLCQRFRKGDDVSVLRSEGCVHTRGAAPWVRLKTEVLSRDPYVVLYYDFVTDREADVIVNKAMTSLTRALTGNDPNDFTLRAHRRLGKIAWLPDCGSRVASRVSRRVQEVTGLHTARRPTASFGEDFQVVNYGIGGHYIPHHDYFKKENAFSQATDYLQASGDRAATFLIYLGNVTLGGATVFPSLGIGAIPVKNAALFWYNFTPDGLPDKRTLHGGCPVIVGEKWVANKWIHEISTAMTKSCKTDPWKPEGA